MTKTTTPKLAVCADPPHEVPLQERAERLSIALSIAKTRVGSPGCDLLLAVTPGRLELRVLRGEDDLVGGHAVYAQLESIDTVSPAGRRLDMPLLKAVGIKKGRPDRPSVIDCTAGLGEDAWLLASHGCRVLAYERQPVIAALLQDAVERAASIRPEIASRIQLRQQDASAWLVQSPDRQGGIVADMPLPLPDGRGSDNIDAIVLDPMFPLGRKARERKPMRVLRVLAGDDADAPALLDAALSTGVHRVCVKRPLHAPSIAHEQRAAPDVVYKGKAVRFDVYLNHG